MFLEMLKPRECTKEEKWTRELFPMADRITSLNPKGSGAWAGEAA